MKRFKLGEWVNYRPLECNGKVIVKSKDCITIKLSQPNVENKDTVEVCTPFTLVEHLGEPHHR